MADIAIAGCGIAGLAAATLLARAGHRVTLYDRFETPRPLGSGLMIQPTGLAVLAALGLADRAVVLGAPVHALLGRGTHGEPVLEAAYSDLPVPDAFGLGIHRASLFGMLFDAARASGAMIVTGRAIAASVIDGEARRLTFVDSTRSPPHELVIDALGVGSPLVPQNGGWLPFGALWATVDWPCDSAFSPTLLEQRYDRASRMVGLLPVGGGRAAFFWSLRADRLDRWRQRGMAAFREEVCALWPACETVMDQLAAPEHLTFARYAHRTARQPTGERIVHLGDAWHAASPQLGQGANMALLDAWALGRAIAETPDLAAALARYRALRQGHVRLYQWLTRTFTPPFQSDSIWPALLRDLVMAPGSRVPPGPRLKATLVAGLAAANLPRLGLALPDYSALGGVSGGVPGAGLAASPSTIAARASSLDQS
ncbi:NAD(P)-binding protein [Erythrobacter arachoides]|uniref:NAD(P)-binding protein n=1 Tax=Aurantiacibacter arachoides TaxID=1850444 RepID=A0A845A1I3_9SPHN|nr:NAD(P)/FAD-dependent oxidoreductase [Aurantiacibacter arachoides]MXO93778.1 NAD(P)-binding protein [Aurantiacibacter arachoides]GGD46725.1 glutamate synthase [Aurantiacibacter arachoides]